MILPRLIRDNSHWLVLLLILAVTLILRLQFVHVPIDRDEGTYASIAQEILRGGIPYRDAIEIKPPGTFYLYALFFSLPGSGVEQLRVATALYVLLTVCCIFLTARRLWGRNTGLLAALLFGLFSNGPVVQGWSSNTEVFMTLPLLVCIYFCTRWLDDGQRRLLAAGGFFGGLAMLIKTVALPMIAMIACCLALPQLRTRKLPAMALDLLAFIAPSLLLLLLLNIYLAHHGAWNDFLYWNVTFAKLYASDPLNVIFDRFFSRGVATAAEFLPLWVVGVPAAVWGIWKQRSLKTAFIALCTISIFVGVCMPGKFWPHYFIPLIAPLALLTALGLKELWSRKGLALQVAAPLVAAALAYTVIMDYRYYLVYTPDQISTATYGGNDVFVTSAQAAEYVKSRTAPTDYIFQWGWEPEIYALSERRSPSRYICHLLPGSAPDPDGAVREMMLSLYRKRPIYILIQQGREGWPGYREISGLIASFYRYEQTIGTFTIFRRV